VTEEEEEEQSAFRMERTMNGNTLLGAIGVIGFIFSCVSLAYLFFSRGQASGRVIQAIQQSADNQREMNSLLQAQAVALASFGEGMKTQGEAMHAVAQGFQDFARGQAETNDRVWLAIQTGASRTNDLIANCRECKYAETHG
jgi:hypothetical protein